MNALKTIVKEIWQRIDQRILIFAVIVLGGAWGFVELADDAALENDYAGIERSIMESFRVPGDPHEPIGPAWLKRVAIDVTTLGDTTVLTMLSLGVIGYLLVIGRGRTALFMAGTVSVGAIGSTVFKLVFARPRPDFVPHLVEVSSMSFPSGHAMVSSVVYLTIAATLARTTDNRAERVYVLTIAAILCGLIGLTRVYLGVHYPTDVLGGWCAGSAWATACSGTAYWLQKRRMLRPAAADAA